MWLERRRRQGTASPGCVAVLVAALAGFGPAPARASDDTARILAAEILVMRADLAQIEKPGLPAPHRAGFVKRIAGTLGLVPWYLIAEGDDAGAGRVADWQTAWTGADAEVAPLDRLLERLSARHPLDLSAFDIGVTRAELAEARAIHEAYCAGCHDGSGTGDPEAELAARDLFWMARDEASDQFLARLVNGVRGDETIGFVNPLTDKQIAALWKLYTFH